EGSGRGRQVGVPAPPGAQDGVGQDHELAGDGHEDDLGRLARAHQALLESGGWRPRLSHDLKDPRGNGLPPLTLIVLMFSSCGYPWMTSFTIQGDQGAHVPASHNLIPLPGAARPGFPRQYPALPGVLHRDTWWAGPLFYRTPAPRQRWLLVLQRRRGWLALF